MSPDEAIGSVAREAMSVADAATDRGGFPADTARRLLRVIQDDIAHLLGHLALEATDPAAAAEETQVECRTRTCRSLASAALLLYATSPGIEDEEDRAREQMN